MAKIMLVVNEDRFFLSHRKEIAKRAKELGHEVIVVSKDTGQANEIREMGFRTIDLPIDPTSMNPLHEIPTLFFLINLYRKEKPDIVHHVGMKNILWGGLAAWLTRVRGVVNAVSGLGGLFNGEKLSLPAKGVLAVMRLSHRRKRVKVIFQNNDDKELFLQNRVVNKNQVRFIKGSGVDLNDFTYTEDPGGDSIRVMFTARMVKEKGVKDLIKAAELLRDNYKEKVHFLLCGRLADNNSAIPEEYLASHCDGKYICWLGLRDDIKELLQSSHIMAFPSYYREGVPKSLIEACAVGLPIVTCDSVGCRDVVEDGVNGFLIPPKDVKALAEKLEILINSPELRREMGRKSREKAEHEFSLEKVVNKHMDIYESLLG